MIGLSVGVFALGLIAESGGGFDVSIHQVYDTRYLGQPELKALGQLGIEISTYKWIFIALDIAFFSLFAGAAFIIIARRSDNWMALIVSMALILYGTTGSLGFLTLSESPPSWSFILNSLN